MHSNQCKAKNVQQSVITNFGTFPMSLPTENSTSVNDHELIDFLSEDSLLLETQLFQVE